jgi:DNA primase
VFGIEKWGEVEVYVLCEGELDVVALWQIGIPAISTGSAHLSEIQSRIVRDHCDEVVVFYDTDNAGNQATWGYWNKDGEFKPGLVQKIRPFLRVRVVEEHKHDPSKLIEKKRIRELRRLIENAPSSTRMLIGR